MRSGLLLFLVLSVHLSFAQSSAPKYSNEFLAIGVGGRGLAMAGSQTAITNDVTAAYWNPAGLLEIEAPFQFSLMHAEYFAGIAKYDYAGFATKVDSTSVLAFSIIRFAVDDIPDTRFLYDANGAINYDNIRFFAAADYAFLVSYARRIPQWNNLKVGANFKVVHRIAGDFANAWGFGLDAGAQYATGKWKFGLMLRDITGTWNAWSHNPDLVTDIYTQTGNDIPENSVEITLPRAILGGGYAFSLPSEFGLLVAMDLIMTFDGKRNTVLKTDLVSIEPTFGMELDYKKIAYLRGGVGNIQEIKDFDGSTYREFQPNFGLGIRLKNASVDYAMTDIGDQSESLYSHVFSLTVSLDKK